MEKARTLGALAGDDAQDITSTREDSAVHTLLSIAGKEVVMATMTETSRASAEAWARPALDAIEEGARHAERQWTHARHRAEDAVTQARLVVRRHPLSAVSVGAVAGAVFGAACGLAIAWFARARE